MKTTWSEIKQATKDRVNSRFGDALLIVLVPGIIVFGIQLFTGMFLTGLSQSANFIASQLISQILGFFSAYVVLFMMVRYAKGRDGFSFEGVFDNTSKLWNFILVQIILGLIGTIALIPLLSIGIEPLIEVTTYQNDPQAMQEFIEESFISNEALIQAFQLTALIAIIIGLVVVKFQFATYLIVDKGLSAVEALKESWRMTNGNYFRVLFFPLTWILWTLLSIITCGIALIYVIPLVTAGSSFLYLAIDREVNGTSDFAPKEKQVESDPLADDYYN